MNNQRRKALAAIMASVEEFGDIVADVMSKAGDIVDALEYERDAEQEAFDNLPENMQCGERGGNMEAAIEQMETALEMIRALADLEFEKEGIITALDEAKQ